jgi:hypothetical protein
MIIPMILRARAMRALFPAMVAIAAQLAIWAAIVWRDWDAGFDTPGTAISTPSSVASLLGENATATTGDLVYLNNVERRIEDDSEMRRGQSSKGQTGGRDGGK